MIQGSLLSVSEVTLFSLTGLLRLHEEKKNYTDTSSLFSQDCPFIFYF